MIRLKYGVRRGGMSKAGSRPEHGPASFRVAFVRGPHLFGQNQLASGCETRRLDTIEVDLGGEPGGLEGPVGQLANASAVYVVDIDPDVTRVR